MAVPVRKTQNALLHKVVMGHWAMQSREANIVVINPGQDQKPPLPGCGVPAWSGRCRFRIPPASSEQTHGTGHAFYSGADPG